jgi:transcriptional regulator with XRE-family HTH domain
MIIETTLPTVSESLRLRLESGPSVRRLSRQSGVDRAVISRFKRGERSVTLETADRLASALGLALTPSH